jgi:hypothetical protein
LRVHPRTTLTLALLFLLAGLLSWALAGRADARSSLFQSNLLESPLATPAPPPLTPVPLPTELLPSPTLLLPTPIPIPTETPSGFLPPPTLTLRETPTPVLIRPTFSALETPLAARTARAPTPTPAPPPGIAAPDLAPLLDTGLAAFGYIWLACGVILLAGAAVAFIWLWRRRPPGA